MSARPKVILLTGFEPFGGYAENSSQAVIGRLARARIPGVALETLLLPVVFDRAFGKVAGRLDSSPPLDAVVLLGMAARATKIRLERLAVNLMDTESFAGGRRPVPRPDNAGQAPVDREIVPGGALALPATADVKRLARGLLAQGHPVETSLSAGSYVCNDLYYRTLHHLSRQPPDSGLRTPDCLFVHLPELPHEKPLKVLGTEVPGVTVRARKCLEPEVQARTVAALLELLARA